MKVWMGFIDREVKEENFEYFLALWEKNSMR
jgi:hypothetical protein